MVSEDEKMLVFFEGRCYYFIILTLKRSSLSIVQILRFKEKCEFIDRLLERFKPLGQPMRQTVERFSMNYSRTLHIIMYHFEGRIAIFQL